MDAHSAVHGHSLAVQAGTDRNVLSAADLEVEVQGAAEVERSLEERIRPGSVAASAVHRMC